MRHITFLFIISIFVSCSNNDLGKEIISETVNNSTQETIIDTLQRTDSLLFSEKEQDSIEQAAIDDFNFSTYYIVAIDSSMNYYDLHATMLHSQAATDLKIDSLGRYYDAKKDLICLPDTVFDELYRGEYYPRRHLSEFLSIEYYDFFNENTVYKNMVLLAAIYDNKKSADSLHSILKIDFPNSFTEASEVYVGCMH